MEQAREIDGARRPANENDFSMDAMVKNVEVGSSTQCQTLLRE